MRDTPTHNPTPRPVGVSGTSLFSSTKAIRYLVTNGVIVSKAVETNFMVTAAEYSHL